MCSSGLTLSNGAPCEETIHNRINNVTHLRKGLSYHHHLICSEFLPSALAFRNKTLQAKLDKTSSQAIKLKVHGALNSNEFQFCPASWWLKLLGCVSVGKGKYGVVELQFRSISGERKGADKKKKGLLVFFFLPGATEIAQKRGVIPLEERPEVFQAKIKS